MRNPRALRPRIEPLESRVLLASITGKVFIDLDHDGTFEPGDGETGVGRQTVFIDTNNNGAHDGGEPSVESAANGDYTFGGLPAGTHNVRLAPKRGMSQTSPTDTATDNVLIAATNHVDHIFDPVRKIQYISTSDGAVLRYDVINRAILAPIQVGVSPTAIDVTPDGRFLYVGEGAAGALHGMVRKVDLDTGVITNIQHNLNSGEQGVVDLVVMGNGKAFFTTSYSGSGQTPLHEIDLSNDSVSDRTTLWEGTRLDRNSTRNQMFMVQPNLSNGPISYYDAGTDSFPASVNVGLSLGIFNSAVSPDGQTFIIGQELRDTNLNLIRNDLPNHQGGVVFDPIANILYGIDIAQDDLVAMDLGTPFNELSRTAITENIPNGNRQLSISPDGQYLFLSTGNGVRMFVLRTPGRNSFSLTANQDVTDANFGTQIVNSPPVAIKDAPKVATNSANNTLNVLANDFPAAHESLTITAVGTTNNGGTVTIAPGNLALTYTPAANFTGIETFTYTVQDGQGRSFQGEVCVTVKALDGTGTIRGMKWNDLDGDGIFEPGASETPMAGVTIFVDINNNGTLNPTEPMTVTDAQGNYEFTGLAPNTYAVREVAPTGYYATFPLQPSPTNFQINVPNRTVHVYDHSRHLVYIATSTGMIERFDVLSRTLLEPFHVGVNLSSMDITTDSQFLYVAEAQHGPTQGMIRKVSLEDGAVTNLVYDQGSLESGAFDIVIMNNQKAFFTTSFSGSGNIQLREIDLSNDQITNRTSIRQNSHIVRGSDRSLFLLTQSNSSAGPLFTYAAATDSFPSSANTGAFLDSINISVNRDGTLLANDLGSANVISADLTSTNEILSLSRGGLIFDPVRDVLYVTDHSSNEIVAYHTSTFDELFRIAVGENIGAGYREMSVTTDGRYLFLSTSNGVRMYEIANAGLHSVTLNANDLVEGLNFGNKEFNDPPRADDDFYSVATNSQNNILNVLVNDFTNPQDTLTIINISTPDKGGTAVVNGSVIHYTPATDFKGVERFEYTVRDPDGRQVTAEVVLHVKLLDGRSEIRGRKWTDFDRNGRFDPSKGEIPLAGWTIFLDNNNNGQPDPTEPQTTTDADGYYAFDNLVPGSYRVSEEKRTGWDQTSPITASIISNDLIPVATRRDHVYDTNTQTLYISTSTGHVQRYHVPTKTLLVPWAVGTNLNGIDIDPTNQFLYVAEQTVTATQGTVKKVNIATGVVTDLNYTRGGSEDGTWDIAIAANNKAFVTTRYSGSGNVPLRELDLTTEVFTIRNPPGNVRQNTRIGVGPTRNLLVFSEANSSGGPMFTYNSANDTFSAKQNTFEFVDNSTVSVSPDGTQLLYQNGRLALIDTNFDLIEVYPSAYSAGVVFDPSRKMFFVGDAVNDDIVGFGIGSLTELFRTGAGENITSHSVFNQSEISLSSDSEYLFLSTTSGIRMYDVFSTDSHLITVPANQILTDRDFGNAPNNPALVLAVLEDEVAETAGAMASKAIVTRVGGNNAVPLTVTIAGDDASEATGPATVTIPANQHSVMFDIAAIDDLFFDGTQTVNFTASATGYLSDSDALDVTDNETEPTVTLSINNASIPEAGGVATITATLSNISETPITVNLGTSGNAIGGGTDYNLSGQSIVIAGSSLTGTATITAVNDNIREPNESVTVDITSIVGATENGDQQVTTEIIDDDPEPSVTMTIDNASIPENGGSATITATLSNPSSFNVILSFVYSGTATQITDYSVQVSQIVIGPGSLSETVTINTVSDMTDEVDETVIVDINGVTNGTESGNQQVITTILDDDPVPTVSLSVDKNNISESGGEAVVTATLSNPSSGDITVNLGYSGTATGGGADYTANTTQVVISAGDLTGIARVTAASDEVDEQDETVIVDITSVVGATENGTQQITTLIADDDTAGITVAQTNNSTGTVNEAGAIDVFTVVLDTQPTSNVVINVTSGDTGEATVDKGSLTFSPANWNSPQTVSVTGQDDFVDDGNQATDITLSVDDPNSDDVYDQLADKIVSVTTVDDDTAGVTVTPTGNGTSVSESGTTDSFNVTLSSQPTSDVVVNVSSGDTGEATVDVTSLTFTTANWNAPQTVTATGIDDVTIDGNQDTTVTLSIDDSQSDDVFDPLSDIPVTVTTIDNDSAGFTISESGGTSVNESGTSDTFGVVLNRQPLTNVVIKVEAGANDEMTFDKSVLTFTPANWDTVQTVTVTGVDDPTVDGDQTTDVTLSVDDDLSDTAFDPLPNQTVSVTTVDNDPADFTITQTGGTTSVSEAQTSDTFDVVLDNQPLSIVVINIASGDSSEATVNKSSLTFTPNNWNAPQTVTVNGINDIIKDGDKTTAITLSINDAASDDAFDNLADKNVNVTTVDNEAAGFVVTETGGNTGVSEDVTTDKINVSLIAQPETNVVINVASNDTSEATVDVATLTFTPNNWHIIQTVTVTGVNDPDVDGDQTSNITFTVDDSASDDFFDSLPDQTVPVTTLDNEVAGFAVTQSGGTTIVSESGTTDTFTVTLTGKPLTNVEVTVTSADTGEATVDKATLTFTPANWNAPQLVTVTGVDEPLIDGDQTTNVTISINDGNSDDAFDALADQTVSVTTTDDDSPGLVVVETNNSTRVTESGSTDTFTVALAAQPASNVVVKLTNSDQGEATADKSSLIFTPANWNVPQTVTMTGVDDSIADLNQVAVITLSIDDVASDDQYDTVADKDVVVENTDDDTGIIVTETGNGTTVSEAGTTDTFSVVLKGQPLGLVGINVVSADPGEAAVDKNLLIFNPNNWNVPQVVTVSGVDDNALDGQQTTNVVVLVNDPISHNAFDNVPNQSVSVTTNDNDAINHGVGLFRPGNARFYQDANHNGVADLVRGFGAPGDIPIIGDWNGDGRDGLGIYRPSSGLVALDDNADGVIDRAFLIGIAGDQLYVGDFDGDGTSDLLVYRPSKARVFIDLGTNGTLDRIYSAGVPFQDRIVVGDFNGDGTDDVIYHRFANATMYFDYSANGTIDKTFKLGANNIDTVMAGNFSGVGDGVLIYRKSSAQVFIDINNDGVVDRFFKIGAQNIDNILVGDINGDGFADLVIHRAGSGKFFIDFSADGTVDEAYNWGATTDIPLIGRWGTASQAANGQGSAASTPLTNAALSPVVDAAKEIWAGVGLTSGQLDRLYSAQVKVEDLVGSQLGVSLDNSIVIDADPAGHGWFVDRTPMQNEEFSDFGDDGLLALAGSAAAGRMDLLSVVLHELGHVLGLEHNDSPLDIMNGTLATGTRRI